MELSSNMRKWRNWGFTGYGQSAIVSHINTSTGDSIKHYFSTDQSVLKQIDGVRQKMLYLMMVSVMYAVIIIVLVAIRLMNF